MANFGVYKIENMVRRLIVILALGLLLTGCDDPVRVEKANAIRRESEAQYMATATAVATERDVALQELSERADVIADQEAVRAATQPQRIARNQTIQKWAGGFFVAYISVVFLAFAIAAIGSGIAGARKANLEAELIRIDKTTRTWPVLVQKGHILMLETGERFKITDVSPVHPGQLAISGQVRNVGLLAQSAERVAKTTKSAQPADMLPTIGQSVPVLTPGEEVDIWPPPIQPKIGETKGM